MIGETPRPPEGFSQMIAQQRRQYDAKPRSLANEILQRTETDPEFKKDSLHLLNQVLEERLIPPREGETTETKIGRGPTGYLDYAAKRQAVTAALEGRQEQPLRETTVEERRLSDRKPIHVELFLVLETNPALLVKPDEVKKIYSLLRMLYEFKKSDFKTPKDIAVESVGVKLQPLIQTSAGEVMLEIDGSLSLDEAIAGFADSLQWANEFDERRDQVSLLQTDEYRNRLGLSEQIQQREKELREKGKQPVIIPVFISRDFSFQKSLNDWENRYPAEVQNIFPAVMYTTSGKRSDAQKDADYGRGAVIGSETYGYPQDQIRRSKHE